MVGDMLRRRVHVSLLDENMRSKGRTRLEQAGHPQQHGIEAGMYVPFSCKCEILVNRMKLQEISNIPPKNGLYSLCVQREVLVTLCLRNNITHARHPSCRVQGPCVSVPLQFPMPGSASLAR
jgi:hypothetical protein